MRPTTSRFLFLDGLRGVACLGVLFHHLFENSELVGPLATLFPRWLILLAGYGACGVQIFFVLSGFVIAYSVRDMRVTGASLGNFILRRQIRLDPVYWCCLMLAIADYVIRWHAHPAAVAAPTTGAVVVNFLYLQDVLHQPIYLGVSWTLCLEIQFYLVFILILGAAQFLFLPSERRARYAAAGMILALAAVSLAVGGRRGAYLNRIPWFIGSWFLFAAGVMACWSLIGKTPAALFGVLVAAILAMGLINGDATLIVGSLTAAIIWAVGRLHHLQDWLSNAPLQYFGRISYSLYLIHLLVLSRIYKFGIHQTGLAKWPALGWFALAAVASVGAAHLLHILIERPTMRFASRIKRSPKAPTSDEAVRTISLASLKQAEAPVNA